MCDPLSPSSILTILPNFSPFSSRNSFLLVFLTQHFPVYFLFLFCLFQHDLHALLECLSFNFGGWSTTAGPAALPKIAARGNTISCLSNTISCPMPLQQFTSPYTDLLLRQDLYAPDFRLLDVSILKSMIQHTVVGVVKDVAILKQQRPTVVFSRYFEEYTVHTDCLKR